MTDNLDTNKLDTMSTLEDLLIDYETAQSFDIKNTALQAIEAYIAERERLARIDENERYLNMLETGNWRSFGTEVTERLDQLKGGQDAA